jgi:prefoldin subunit 5
MSDRLDRIEALLEGHGMAMADLRTRQEVMQQQQERFQTQIESSQKQIESLASLISDTRQATLYLLETANNHENRLVKLETPQSDAPPN